jgi:hypothetical protein
MALRPPEALPVRFVSPANGSIFADCDEAGGTVRATRSDPASYENFASPASLMMRVAALSTIPAMPKTVADLPSFPSVVFTGPLRSGYLPPDEVPPAIIGIDDWAWRRNHRYGTLIMISSAERRSRCYRIENRRSPKRG